MRIFHYKIGIQKPDRDKHIKSVKQAAPFRAFLNCVNVTSGIRQTDSNATPDAIRICGC